MAALRCTCLFSLLAATTQLNVKAPDGSDLESPSDDDSGMIHDFGVGGVFEAMRNMKEELGRIEEEGARSGLIGHATQTENAESWPAGSWKSKMEQGDKYGPASTGTKWPMPDTRQCSDADMKVLHFWALKQAKTRLPAEGKNGTFGTGQCYKNNVNQWIGLHVPSWAKCYQKFYDVSTNCAQCIGSVYQMAYFNWSEPCYNFCYGRPNKKDGAHWCWEDCQSCMWYVGHRLSICYGEPYDMVCRYAKELGKEDWFKKNGINVKSR